MLQSINSVKSYNSILFAQNNNINHSFKGESRQLSDSYEKTLQPQKIGTKIKFGFFKDTLSGSVDGKDFEIKQSASFKNMLKLNGTFDGKPVHIEGKYRTFRPVKITGQIGDKKVDLIYKQNWCKYNLKGNFDGKEIDIKMKNGWNSRKIKGEGIDMNFKNKGLFSNQGSFKGYFQSTPELLPLLLALINKANNDEAAMIMLCL